MMGYNNDFRGLPLASAAFDAKWRELAKNPAFEVAQHDFIKKTHYDPQQTLLEKNGFRFSDRGPAVQDAIWSTAVQFGPRTQLIIKALQGFKDPNNLTDKEIVKAIQKRKIDNNNTFFRSSSAAVRRGTLNRARNAKRDLIQLAEQSKSKKE